MPSLIEGYNYDIFISYRQKDNKYDEWVTKFVDKLKKELEATFKEDVSLYFDENPHDRLQETHDVDKSLESKLKCLIFIPILSQTYCDPNSYAWKYEFLPFLQMVKNDRFGKDVKLRGGNVASRVLPIRIHDLEQDDIKLYEKETGSVLRALDFVFRTASGVNRPLLPDDNKNDNLNKTLHRDQVNKLAGAVKEVIAGMKAEPARVVISDEQFEASGKEVREIEQNAIKEKPDKSGKARLISAITVLVLLFVAGIIVYQRIFKRDSLEKLRTSDGRITIAVMPFQNLTNDTIWNVWQGGIKDMMISYLSNFPEALNVRQSQIIDELLHEKSTKDYSSLTPTMIRAISDKLDADIIISGSINKAGSVTRVNAQLINTITTNTYKSFYIEVMNEKEIFAKIDSLSVLTKNYMIITLLGKELPEEFQNPNRTLSPEAYRFFIYGNRSFYDRDFPTACNMLLEAIRKDSSFVDAMSLLSYAYINQGLYEDAKKWCLIRREKLREMSLNTDADPIYSILFEEPKAVITILNLRLINDKQNARYYSMIGNRYVELKQYDKAVLVYEKELEIYKSLRSKPRWVTSYTSLGSAYHKMGMYRKEKKLYEKAEEDFPNYPDLIYNQILLALSEGKTKLADEYIKRYISVIRENGLNEAGIARNLAKIYWEANMPIKAEEYYRKALNLEPGDIGIIHEVAFFFIDTERNLNEGMALVEKALRTNQDDYELLDVRGWGLFKQGKFKDSLETLQKSWDIRREKAIYNYEAYLHLEAAKKAVAEKKIE